VRRLALLEREFAPVQGSQAYRIGVISVNTGLVIALFAAVEATVPALLGSGVMAALQRLTKSDQGRCAPTR
jgi:hypothetical protein